MTTETPATPVDVAFVVFPKVTQLDFTGPVQVLSRWPGARVHVVAHSLDPVPTDAGFSIVPTTTFTECPAVDVVCVPGGDGVFGLLEDREVLEFLVRVAANARWVTSVCTGAFLLAAAGLLTGRRAATHWASRELLAEFGVDVLPERVVIDGRFVTGGGVTAGIDFALTLTALEFGDDQARLLQLIFEYDPAPPFAAGSPDLADPQVVQGIRAHVALRRAAVVAQAVAARAARGD